MKGKVWKSLTEVTFTSNTFMNLDSILNKEELTQEEIVFLLSLSNTGDIEKLYNRADELRALYCGNEVHFRGILEFSNYCVQNCIYCGLREDNYAISRYRMTPDEIIDTTHKIVSNGIGTIILQSGEDPYFDTDLMAYIVYSIKQKNDIAITLSMGERGFDEYRTWKIAGADRYLLKHETANAKNYSVYHNRQKLSDRLAHLQFLKNLGYQIGTGSIIGLPLQTAEDIADDILLCKELDVDMAVFDPFIATPNTPYRSEADGSAELTLKTIAAARIVLKNSHITATAETDAADESGRAKGLSAGANVVMPDLTPQIYRSNYKIYPGMRSADESPEESSEKLEEKITAIGRKISFKRGDSLKNQRFREV